MIKLVDFKVLHMFGEYVNSSDIGLQVEALWGLSNIACHSSYTAAIIIDDEVLAMIVTAMGSRHICVKREAYFVIGNLFNELTSKDLVCLIDKYPGILVEYVNGLEYFANNKLTVIHIL